MIFKNQLDVHEHLLGLDYELTKEGTTKDQVKFVIFGGTAFHIEVIIEQYKGRE